MSYSKIVYHQYIFLLTQLEDSTVTTAPLLILRYYYMPVTITGLSNKMANRHICAYCCIINFNLGCA